MNINQCISTLAPAGALLRLWPRDGAHLSGDWWPARAQYLSLGCEMLPTEILAQGVRPAELSPAQYLTVATRISS